jgi:hypothetical protein
MSGLFGGMWVGIVCYLLFGLFQLATTRLRWVKGCLISVLLVAGVAMLPLLHDFIRNL